MPLVHLVYDVRGSLRFCDQGNAMLVELPPDFRQREAAARAIEDANLQLFLQCANAPAELRRLYAEGAGRNHETPMLNDFREEPKIIEVGDLIHCRVLEGLSTTTRNVALHFRGSTPLAIPGLRPCRIPLRLLLLDDSGVSSTHGLFNGGAFSANGYRSHRSAFAAVAHRPSLGHHRQAPAGLSYRLDFDLSQRSTRNFS